MLDEYTRLFEAIEGAISQEKSYSYRWIWKRNKENVKIIDIEVGVKIHSDKILQYDSKQSFRILGILMNPILMWDKQFVIMI